MKETPLLGMGRGVGRRERWRPGVLYGIDGEGGEEWRGRKWMPQGVSPKCLRGGKYRERSALSCTIWRLSREFSDLQKLVCFHVICSVSRYAWDQWRTYRENIGRAKLSANWNVLISSCLSIQSSRYIGSRLLTLGLNLMVQKYRFGPVGQWVGPHHLHLELLLLSMLVLLILHRW
jgi:hypothetical protein